MLDGSGIVIGIESVAGARQVVLWSASHETTKKKEKTIFCMVEFVSDDACVEVENSQLIN